MIKISAHRDSNEYEMLSQRSNLVDLWERICRMNAEHRTLNVQRRIREKAFTFFDFAFKVFKSPSERCRNGCMRAGLGHYAV